MSEKEPTSNGAWKGSVTAEGLREIMERRREKNKERYLERKRKLKEKRIQENIDRLAQRE